MAPLARSFMMDTVPVEVHADRVVIGLDREFSSEKENLSVQRNRVAVQHVLARELGRDVSAELKIVDVARHALPASAPEEDEENGSSPPPDDGERITIQDWYKDETVRRVCDIFDGQVKDVRE